MLQSRPPSPDRATCRASATAASRNTDLTHIAGCSLAGAEICRAPGTGTWTDLRDQPTFETDHDGDLGRAFAPPRRLQSRTVMIQWDVGLRIRRKISV